MRTGRFGEEREADYVSACTRGSGKSLTIDWSVTSPLTRPDDAEVEVVVIDDELSVEKREDVRRPFQ